MSSRLAASPPTLTVGPRLADRSPALVPRSVRGWRSAASAAAWAAAARHAQAVPAPAADQAKNHAV